jgi:phosphotransferase system  glucose/maltose/N-acetylglucosamine-specific IIC component
MLQLRRLHLYLGTLFAPSIILFAFSGALQVLGLHEAEDAEAAQPPAWIVTMASLHKDQHLPRPKTHKTPAAITQMRAEHAQQAAHSPEHAGEGNHADARPEPDAAAKLSQTLLKAFVLLMAIGLIVSAALGIFIAVKNDRTRRVAWIMVALGILLPAAALLL